jgi:hypothetical protein
MSEETAHEATWLSIFVAGEHWHRLQRDLVSLGVRGYTFTNQDGLGVTSSGKVRVEAKVERELGHAILKRLLAGYARFELVADVRGVGAVVRGALA